MCGPIKCFWLEDDKGRVYGNARIFKHGCVPKLYSSKEMRERLFLNDPRHKFKRDWIIKEGELNEIH